MSDKNIEVVKLVREFGEVFKKYCELKDEVEKELNVYSSMENWSKESWIEDEEYGMRLFVMKEYLDVKD